LLQLLSSDDISPVTVGATSDRTHLAEHSQRQNALRDALGGPAKRWTESLPSGPQAVGFSGSPGVIAVSCGMPATKAMDSARPGGGLGVVTGRTPSPAADSAIGRADV